LRGAEPCAVRAAAHGRGAQREPAEAVGAPAAGHSQAPRLCPAGRGIAAVQPDAQDARPELQAARALRTAAPRVPVLREYVLRGRPRGFVAVRRPARSPTSGRPGPTKRRCVRRTASRCRRTAPSTSTARCRAAGGSAVCGWRALPIWERAPRWWSAWVRRRPTAAAGCSAPARRCMTTRGGSGARRRVRARARRQPILTEHNREAWDLGGGCRRGSGTCRRRTGASLTRAGPLRPASRDTGGGRWRTSSVSRASAPRTLPAWTCARSTASTRARTSQSSRRPSCSTSTRTSASTAAPACRPAGGGHLRAR